MELPPEIAAELRRRWEYARAHCPANLSTDGRAVRVDGSIGYDCWVSPDGDLYMETYDIATEDTPVIDRSRRAQLLVLTLGARTLPQLLLLLPKRPAAAATCSDCRGEGWFRAKDGEGRDFSFVCMACCGLGWLEDGEPTASADRGP
jgi:hypothetical protein